MGRKAMVRIDEAVWQRTTVVVEVPDELASDLVDSWITQEARLVASSVGSHARGEVRPLKREELLSWEFIPERVSQ